MLQVERRKYNQREFRGPQPCSVAILAPNPGSRKGDQIVQDRIRETNIRQEVESQVKYQKSCDLRADWERSTDKRIQSNEVKRRVVHRRREMELSLESRRDRLSKLLQDEERQFSKELDESQETVIERQARLRDRSRQLKEKKETERQQIVTEKMDQLFRDQCEELRSKMSQKRLEEVAKERVEQIRLKAVIDQRKHEDDRFFDHLWELEYQKKVAREERDAEADAKRNREMAEILLQQKAALEIAKTEERRLKAQEAKLLDDMAQLRKLEQERALEEKRRDQRKTRQLLDESIRAKMKRRAREVQAELAFDMQILEAIMKEAAVEEENRNIRKQELRDEDRRYREYLRQMKLEEEARERDLDRLVDIEIEKQWQKRVEQWDLEKQARKTMLQDVIDGLQRQMQERILENERKRQEAAAEVTQILAQIEANKQLDVEEAAARRQRELEYGSDLSGQIRYNDGQREAGRQARRNEVAQMAADEVAYRDRLRAVMEADWVDPYAHPMRRPHLERPTPQ